MNITNNTEKKKWLTPRKLGLSSKKTKAGTTFWLPEGSTSRNSTPRYSYTSTHTPGSSYSSNTIQTGTSFSTIVGQS